jgi:hypothetical protein
VHDRCSDGDRVHPHRHAVTVDDRRQRSRADDGIDVEMHQPLVAAERGRGLLPHVAVERTGVDAPPRQEELEHRDVPAEVASTQNTRPEKRRAERAQSATGLHIGGAERQAVLALERLHRRRRAWPRDPVDLREVQPVRA